MKKIFISWRAWFYPVVLLLLSFYAFFYHYQAGQYLMGWDTLHPEFNFLLNFSRLFNGAWRFDQGLGAVAAHAHMADLPRLLVLLILDLFLPQNLLRASYIFLCLPTGILGIYFLSNRLIKKRSLAFLAAIFYFLNLATVQHFYVVFEMFAVQYAALPWLFYLIWQYLERGRKSALLYFAFVSLLATPMAYAFTLAYAYFLALMVFCIVFVLLAGQRRRQMWQRTRLLLLATLLVNAFWLLPNIYFILDSAWQVPLAKTNRLFSTEAYLHNLKYGRLKEALIFKNFLFDWSDYRFDSQTFQALLGTWEKHLVKPLVAQLIYLPSVLSLLAIPLYFINKKKQLKQPQQSFFWGILALTLLNLLLLLPATFPLNHFFDFLRQLSTVFDEGLRFPFTKFSIIFLFGMSMLFAFSLQYLTDLIQKNAKHLASFFKKLGFSLILGLFVGLYWPVFQGELISDRLWLNFPSEYQALFNYMDQQADDGRVALLPAASFWNWEYSDWGFQGAGFLWFALKQPLLTRDFDRWNLHNAQFYRELSTAIYDHDLAALELLCEKYQVTWLLLDQHLISPEYGEEVLQLESIKDLLANSENFDLKEKISDQLWLYHFNNAVDRQGYFFSPTILTPVKTDLLAANQDQIYAINGNYFLSVTGLEFPFYDWWQVDESLSFLNFDWDEQILTMPAPTKKIEFFQQSISVDDLLFPVILEKNAEGLLIKSNFLSAQQQTGLNALVQSSKYLLIDNKQLIDLSTLTKQTIDLPANSEWQFLSDFSQQQSLALDKIAWQVGFCKANQSAGFLNLATEASNLTLTAKLNDVCLSVPTGVFSQQITQPSVLAFNQDGINQQELLYADKNLSWHFSPATDGIEKIWQLNNWQLLTRANLLGKAQVNLSFAPLDWSDQGLLWSISGLTQSFSSEGKTEFCGNKPAQFSQRQFNNDILSLASLDGADCDYINFPDFKHQGSHLLVVESRNKTGLPLRLCLSNNNTQRCDFYTQLHDGDDWQTQYFLIPATADGSEGYELHIQNLAIGQLASSNEIGRVGLYVFPEKLFAAWQLDDGSGQVVQNKLEIKSVKNINQWLYRIKTSDNGYLALNYNFDSGWLAFSHGKILKHQQLNNWANLWELESGQENFVWVIFWPQLLEYFGFLLLIGGAIIYKLYFSRDFSTKE